MNAKKRNSRKPANRAPEPVFGLPASTNQESNGANGFSSPRTGMPVDSEQAGIGAVVSPNPRHAVPDPRTKRKSRKPAIARLKPIVNVPASTNQESERANKGVAPAAGLPADSGGDGGGATANESTKKILPDPISSLREFQAQRIGIIRMQIRIDNATLSLARRYLGWQSDFTEADREKINAAARKLVAAVEDGKPVAAGMERAAQSLTPFIGSAATARGEFDKQRLNIEKKMRDLADQLPAKGFVELISGFGLLGLAIIVGEAGDLNLYSNPGKLWKRLGLAVFGGKAQRKSTNVDEALAMGYNPRRRSAMWTIGDSLLKAQIRKVKDEHGEDTGERTSTGIYGKLYLQRKQYEKDRNPEISDMHAHRRAQRYAEKRLLKNLWQAWRVAVNRKAA